MKIKYLLIFLGYKYITDSINILRIKLVDLLLFLVLIRLAPGFSFHPFRILLASKPILENVEFDLNLIFK